MTDQRAAEGAAERPRAHPCPSDPADPIDRRRFPADPWSLRETRYDAHDLGLTETLFTVANGYLGMRGNPDEGREAHSHGTFVNGFHETWPIRHAESAYGFAQTGQTMIEVPDVKVIKLYVDDEPLMLGTAALDSYERSIDFRNGVLRRTLVWRTPSNKLVKVETTRSVSMTQRHLALLTMEVTLLEGDAPIVVSSQILNRQDAGDEYQVVEGADGQDTDPRKTATLEGRVLLPRLAEKRKGRLLLGYECARSKMTVVTAADHYIETADGYEQLLRVNDDQAKAVIRVDARQGNPLRIDKMVAYHTSRGVPVRELADRCDRTLDRARQQGLARYDEEQQGWYDDFWAASDIEVEDDESIQQAVRFNLFQLAQASARADNQGVPAKGVSGSGYEGHYFWDTEIYVVPFLSYSQPDVARNTLHFRRRMLDGARARAAEMAQLGALFPWRTINGEEASAYYAAGTAQVHIDADIAYALNKYVNATGDEGFLARDGIEILVETARLYADLGFWRVNGDPEFHIHGVTGPDEYTTVVNNNLFTNVMARFNLEWAAQAVRGLAVSDPDNHRRLVELLEVTEDEIAEWERCAEGMKIPYDDALGIHPQDDQFLDRELWDLSRTPRELRPLLLHYHPLVIYRFQVLKQADVVLALFLQGDRFTAEQKRADFEYYDPITTGDSTLSAVVQSVIAAEVGWHEVALEYFRKALYVDLADSHGNTVDGLHIASCGGVWSALVYGFGGLRDQGGRLTFDPRLPDGWPSLTFRLTVRGTRLRVRLTADEIAFTPETSTGSGAPVTVTVRGAAYEIDPAGSTVRVALDGQGPRIDGFLGDQPQLGGVRADGTNLTADVPRPSFTPDDLVLD